MVWSPDLPEGNESGKIKHRIVPFVRGKGLDLGCGPWPVWPHAISVDNFDEWDHVDNWYPDVVSDVTDLALFADLTLDFVYSSHVLEHIKDTEAVLREWWRPLKFGGYLVLYLPHKDFYPNIGQPGSNPDHEHDFHPDDIIDVMQRFAGFDLVVNETRSERDEYSFLQVYKKLQGKRAHFSCNRPKPEKRVLVIRYGGIGDIIQTTPVLAGLKAQGWHITMNTTPHGRQILEHNPNVDDWWIQDSKQVPNESLTEYWTHISREFDHTVNLSEAVEGTLLAVPGRRTYPMPKAARDKLLDVNYQEFIAALGDVPLDPATQVFHATGTEKRWAEKWVKRHVGTAPLIVWPLAGSSVHKIWPWLDQAVEHVLGLSDAHIAFMGDNLCQSLEHGTLQTLALRQLKMDYEESHELGADGIIDRLSTAFWNGKPRIHCLSGKTNIRESIVLARSADVVVGPETGILNALAGELNRKIVLLSHSSAENLTKHWINTTTIEPHVACFPCHRMHYDRQFCPQDEKTGAAACAASIGPQQVVDQILMNVLEREVA